jgi:fructose-1,6-bisphosphatase/sedoheptulose 1,7-bisphosphatase-like protein
MWEQNVDLEFVRVTEATALASARLIGRMKRRHKRLR